MLVVDEEAHEEKGIALVERPDMPSLQKLKNAVALCRAAAVQHGSAKQLGSIPVL